MIYHVLAGLVVISVAYAVPDGIGKGQGTRQVWRIVPSTDEDLREIRNVGEIFKLDFWRGPTRAGRAVDFLVEKSQSPRISGVLKRSKLPDFEVYIDDVDRLIADQQSSSMHSQARSVASRTVADFDYFVYHEANEIYDWMDMVTTEFSDIVKKKQIGVTYEGRPMYVLEFEKTSASGPKPKIFVDSLIHCREWITTASLMYIFKEMLTNQKYSHMLDDVDWYFIPMINVDGYVKTWEQDRMWRKTVKTGASTVCDGVDANRNFDSNWSKPGASPNPCSATYYGPTAESESEVRNLADYVMRFGAGNISAYVTVHSYSQLILYPYGFTDELIPEYDYLDETSLKIHNAMKTVHGKNYVYGPSSTTIYVTSGTTQDWAYDKAGVTLSYTFELRDEGHYGFLLPADQIIPQGEEFIAGLEVLKNVVVEDF